jgi:hypothetical protein
MKRITTPNPKHRRGVAVATIVVTAALALVATACGGSPGSHVAQLRTTTTHSGTTSSSNTSSASAQVNNAVAFARCMRSKRVPNWPDPERSGLFDKTKLTLQQLGAGNSQVQSAQNACQHLLPGFGSGMTPARFKQMRAEALMFSRCIQAHGFPNYPDPGSDGREPDPASVGIDQGSPLWRAAHKACFQP